MASGIYAITHVASGRCYIGSSVNMRARWKTHQWLLEHGRHHNTHMQRAWDKYEPSAFAFKVLEEVPDLNMLLAREQHYLDLVRERGTYNFGKLASAPTLGMKRPPFGPEWLARLSAAAKRRGNCTSFEARSAARKGRKHSHARKVAIGDANRAAHARPETKERMRLAAIERERKRRALGLRRRQDSPETLAKRAASMRAAVAAGTVIVPRFNGPHSEAAKQKMKDAWARKRSEREVAHA